MGLIRGSAQGQATVDGNTFPWDPVNNPNDIELVGYATDGTTNAYRTLRLQNGSAGYQVPVGKTLTVVAVECATQAAAQAASWAFGYGDTDVGATSATPPTTPVYAAAGSPQVVTPATIASRGYRGGFKFPIPTGKYPLGVSIGNAGDRSVCRFYCKLT